MKEFWRQVGERVRAAREAAKMSCEVTCMFEITPGTHGVDGVLACQAKCLNGFCSTRARMFCVPV